MLSLNWFDVCSCVFSCAADELHVQKQVLLIQLTEWLFYSKYTIHHADTTCMLTTIVPKGGWACHSSKTW